MLKDGNNSTILQVAFKNAGISRSFSPLCGGLVQFTEMIISYSHNFIFVRTRKTASSTIEDVLRSNLKSEDIFVSQKRLVNGQNGNLSDIQHDGVAGHMTLREIPPLVAPQFWESCFKFSCERHPYEKAVSLAHYNYIRGKNSGRPRDMEFATYLDKVVRRGSYRGFDHYSIDGKVAVDDFIRFETLFEDLQRVGTHLGLTIPAELPQKKTAHRKDRRPAREVLSDEQKQIVYAHCREEFELFGYSL